MLLLIIRSALQANRLYLEHYREHSPKLLTADGHGTLTPPLFIDPTAKVHPSAEIGPNVSIGAGCQIGEGVRLRNCIILPGVRIGANTCCLGCIIGWDTRIGSWCRIEGDGLNERHGVCILGGENTVIDERVIRNCIVLPRKDLLANHHDEIVM